MDEVILGIGHYTPPKVVTNKDLEKIVDTSDEWIRTRTGKEERRIADDDLGTSDLGLKAAKKALENANMNEEDIDLILVSTVTTDTPFTSVSCMIQDKLGAKHAAAMDISGACAGFMYGMVTAKQFVETG